MQPRSLQSSLTAAAHVEEAFLDKLIKGLHDALVPKAHIAELLNDPGFLSQCVRCGQEQRPPARFTISLRAHLTLSEALSVIQAGRSSHGFMVNPGICITDFNIGELVDSRASLERITLFPNWFEIGSEFICVAWNGRLEPERARAFLEQQRLRPASFASMIGIAHQANCDALPISQRMMVSVLPLIVKGKEWCFTLSKNFGLGRGTSFTLAAQEVRKGAIGYEAQKKWYLLAREA